MFKPVDRCRACGEGGLEAYLDLGEQPLANSYTSGGEPLPHVPLVAALCMRCSHSQLSVVVEPETIFRDYLYVSGTTETYRNHCRDLAKDAVARVVCVRAAGTPQTAPRVLDIACNDGTLLEHFRGQGCAVRGVDPARNLAPVTHAKGIEVVVDFFNDDVARGLAAQGRFDLVTGANVLGHVDDPKSFLEAAKVVLKPGGILIVEFPYGDETIERCEFDQIYHEHVSYFLARSFSVLASRSGLTIDDVLRTPIHGGSIRFFLREGSGPHCGAVARLIADEARKGLHDPRLYRAFADRVAKSRTELPRLLARARARGQKVVGYGASAKGNTMLNHFAIDLDYIVDDNPLKWSKRTPGRAIPILPPAALAEEQSGLAIVVLSWNFLEEIRRKIRALRDPARDDSLVLYVPSVREESLGAAAVRVTR